MILDNSATSNPSTILDPGGDYLTFINTFTVEPDNAEALIEALRKSSEEIFRDKPGFMSANLHISRDRKRVVNYAQWRSKEDYDAASSAPDVRAHVKELGGMATSYDPVDYDLRFCIAR